MLTGTVLLICLLLLIAYFAPTIIAIMRHAHHWLAITVFNLFFGWSGILWILALIIALVAETKKEYKASLRPAAPTVIHVHHYKESASVKPKV